MKNELRIKPLIKFDLKFLDREVEDFALEAESYTFHEESNSLKFWRTGNVIREVFERPVEIVATPVDI